MLTDGVQVFVEQKTAPHKIATIATIFLAARFCLYSFF